MTDVTQSLPPSRRAEALGLSEQLLDDIEFARLAGMDIARRALRLARLLDDAAAMEWLEYEVTGYPANHLTESAAGAAERSGRQGEPTEDGRPRWWTESLTGLEITASTAEATIAGLASSGPSDAPSALIIEQNKISVLGVLRNEAADRRVLRDRIIGAIHAYVARRYDELRFGATVERAFEIVRSEVDARIGTVVPRALSMLSAAFENASSDNPEHWSNAASTCRRLLKESADALYPAGPDVTVAGGKVVKAGPENYVNRLMLWIDRQGASGTSAEMIKADLDYLGRRLDAADRAGQKGAHANVDRFDASRFIVGTYLVLGDVLRLHEVRTQ